MPRDDKYSRKSSLNWFHAPSHLLDTLAKKTAEQYMHGEGLLVQQFWNPRFSDIVPA